MKPLLVAPRVLEQYIEGDGQRFTNLIRAWAEIYLRRVGAKNFTINGVSWRPDGGADGFIEDSAINDPRDWFAAKTVMQFKVGTTKVARAKKDLLSESSNGTSRIRDKIAEGFKVVWFVGKALPDLARDGFEKELAEIVSTISAESPRPLVIDLNRLAELITCTPAVALQVSGNPGLFLTSDAALSQTPHHLLRTFVPGLRYPELQKDIVDFFLNDPSDSIKYVAGEPGIGKTRSILEAVESSNELRGKVCYFHGPSRVEEFFTLAMQNDWRGFAIIDMFLGQHSAMSQIARDTVPKGFKVLLIGHEYRTEKSSHRVADRFEKLTPDEVQKVLAANYPSLPSFRILEAVEMSKVNIRMARLICDFYCDKPNSPGLDAQSLNRIVTEELDRTPFGQDVLKRLSLLPNLASDETSQFCKLVEVEEGSFRQICRQVSQTSGLIEVNGHVAYISIPAVAQTALVHFWNEDTELARRIFANAGEFSERILRSINRLSPSDEKLEMLNLFGLQVADLTLEQLFEKEIGSRFLMLLSADASRYLPVLHRLVMQEVGHLNKFPYEGIGVGRRAYIWCLRDLAQFQEHFQQAEEIVYAFAREEVPSAYSNTASGYWIDWFRAYFDGTSFSYDQRMDLLEWRVRDGDDLDRSLVLRAITDPFPKVGIGIPASRVGGRVAPPEVNLIQPTQIQIAARRIATLFSLLLSSNSEEIVVETVKVILGSRFDWLDMGELDAYLRIVELKEFPDEARNQLVAETRNYVDSGDGREDELDAQFQWRLAQHRELLAKFENPDPIVAILEVAGHGWSRSDEPGTAAHQKLMALANHCLADPKLFKKAVEILCDPLKTGGGQFGRLLGESLDDGQLKTIFEQIQKEGFSPFSYSAIRSAASGSIDRQKTLLSFAAELEAEKPGDSVRIYQMFEDETYFREGGRMLATSNISASLFHGVSVNSAAAATDEMWRFASAMLRRHELGEQDATEVLFTIAGDLAHNQINDDRGFELGLTALRGIPSRESRNSFMRWSDIALWTYQRFPNEVVLLAASREQGEHSDATAALAEISKLDAKAVLDALIPRLKDPFLFSGGLLRVVENVQEEVFESWITKQEADVLVAIADQLPKPHLVDNRAVVPRLTRLFWDYCTPSMGDIHRRALSSFIGHTVGTGTVWGYGHDLYSERIKIGKQLANDPNPSLRKWAETYIQWNERQLSDAVRSKSIDDARRATEF